MLLCAGDHGLVAQGVSAWPSTVTTLMMQTILDGEATVSVPTSDGLEGAHAAHGSHVADPEEAQPGSVPPRGGYGIQAQPGYGTPPGAPQGPYGA